MLPQQSWVHVWSRWKWELDRCLFLLLLCRKFTAKIQIILVQTSKSKNCTRCNFSLNYMLCEAFGGISKGLNVILNALDLDRTVFMLMTCWFKWSDTRIKPGHHANGKQTLICWTLPFWAGCKYYNRTGSLLNPSALSLCTGLGQREAFALPSSTKFCLLSTCSWTHKPHFKCRICIDYALVHHCLNLYKVLIWTSILIFLILSEHLAMTLLSREGLFSLSCWGEVDVQRYSSIRLWLQK